MRALLMGVTKHQLQGLPHYRARTMMKRWTVTLLKELTQTMIQENAMRTKEGEIVSTTSIPERGQVDPG
jgi:hypothetical protein